jgi:hypothetical protein
VIDAEHNAVVADDSVQRSRFRSISTLRASWPTWPTPVRIRLGHRPQGAPRIAQIGAGEEPVAARVAPDGKTLVVANRRGNSVS